MKIFIRIIILTYILLNFDSINSKCITTKRYNHIYIDYVEELHTGSTTLIPLIPVS